jgi:hypothetical protein
LPKAGGNASTGSGGSSYTPPSIKARSTSWTGLADGEPNPSRAEREAAARKRDELKARRPPGMPPVPPPLRDSLHGWSRRHRWSGVKQGGVKQKAKRTGDRHLDKGDRHGPGYMRDYMCDYMRRGRARTRGTDDEAV